MPFANNFSLLVPDRNCSKSDRLAVKAFTVKAFAVLCDPQCTVVSKNRSFSANHTSKVCVLIFRHVKKKAPNIKDIVVKGGKAAG